MILHQTWTNMDYVQHVIQHVQDIWVNYGDLNERPHHREDGEFTVNYPPSWP